MTRLVYTNHAKARMKMRRFSSRMILKIIDKPEQINIQENNKVKVTKTFNYKKRSVVYRKENNKFVIITVI